MDELLPALTVTCTLRGGPRAGDIVHVTRDGDRLPTSLLVSDATGRDGVSDYYTYLRSGGRTYTYWREVNGRDAGYHRPE